MAIGSRVNPNYPIPGLDQSSKGFRDNFATIKREIEDLQSTTIQLTGGVVSEPYQIGSGDGSVVIKTAVNGAYIVLPEPLNAIQYNNDGSLAGDVNLTYDPVSVSVGIGTNVPAYKLDVRGNIGARDDINIRSDSALNQLAAVNLRTASTVAGLLVTNSAVSIGSITATPVSLNTNSIPRVTVTETGSVGIGTSLPDSALHVIGTASDVSRFTGTFRDRDNMIRATISAENSTIGWGLEHRLGDGYVGGIRLDQGGTVSIHSGENMDADLSTSKARIAIDKAGRVGIGVFAPTHALEVNGTFKSTSILDNSIDADRLVGINQSDPKYTLDVVGDIATTGAVISDTSSLTVDDAPLVIDTWPLAEIRSARYIMQVVRGSAPSESVNIVDFVVTHANGVAYTTEFNKFSTGTSLGSVAANINFEFVDVTYTGTASGNRVKLSKTYITY